MTGYTPGFTPRRSVALGCGGCMLPIIILLVVNLALGGYCCDYSLDYYFGKDIPAWGDCVIGVVGGEIIIPAAIIGCVLDACGLHKPLIQHFK